jgi:(1->4)-alpha-D-glucan 1-alpha-D-glucosylmutase
MVKAMREAKRNTSWVEQDGAWEERVLAYCRGLYEHAAFRADFEPIAARVAAAGELHALRQTALKLTVPGVPDVYQGDELVALSLVDPDNRRPVDWARRRALLGAPPADPDTR